MNMRRRAFLTTATATATGAVATAAGGAVTAHAGTDLSAGAKSGETAAPVSRMSELSFFSGRWRGTGTFYLSASGNPKPIIMEIQNGIGYEGFWSTTHTTERKTAQNPDPLTAVYLWGYDPAQEVFVAEWFDSRGGRATQRSSGWDGNRFVFLGTMTSGGSTFTLRDTFVRHDRNSYHHIGEADFGSGWVAVDEEEVHRR